MSTVASSKKTPQKEKKPIKRKEVIKLCRGMSSMLKANITTSDALMFYAQGLPDKDLQETLMAIRARIDSGMMAHLAFAKAQRFDPMIIGIIQAGAESAKLDEAFSALAHRLKIEQTFAAKLRNALLVPTGVIVFVVALFIWSQISVVSKVEETLAGVKQTPDAISQMFFSISHVVQKTWPFFVILVVAAIVVLVKFPKVRSDLLEGTMKRWSLLRKMVMGLRQTAYLGTMHMMYSNGINLSKAATLAASTVAGTPLEQQLLNAAKRYVSSGQPFSDALKKMTTLDPQIGHMIAIGERSASLPTQLAMLMDMYEEDTATYLADFTQIASLITLMFAMVLLGSVFAGSMIPIFMMGPKMMASGGM